MSSSNYCFLTCIQIFQEGGQVFWYSLLLKNFPEFVVVHTVKGFGIVNKTEVDIFLELSCFFDDPPDVDLWSTIWSLVPLPFLNPAWASGNSQFIFCCSLAWKNLSISLLACAAAKSLQLCPTLCDPIDSNPPGSPVPGILQARALEWVAISFSNTWKWKVKGKLLCPVQLFATPWTAAHQALRPWDFPGKSTGVGCHCLLHY